MVLILGIYGLFYFFPQLVTPEDQIANIKLEISDLNLIVDPAFTAPNSSIPRILVNQNQRVIFTFESDEEVTFRIFNYNLNIDIGPTRLGLVLDFNASIPGSHDLELLLPAPEGEINVSHVRVGILVVSSKSPESGG
ncbi:MAG: hypothetical protein V3U49_02575 [Nitrososphaerales archaeon]|jgi:hypothetical protein